MLVSPSVCPSCKHFFLKISKDNGIRVCCDAFPDGIPRLIFNSGYDHREPYPNDNGIRFEINPDLMEPEKESVRHHQNIGLSKRNNEELLRLDKLFPKPKKGKPDYEVFKYCANDEEFDKSDFAFGEKFLGMYNYLIPRILREGDSDPPMPRYIEEPEDE